MRRTLKLTIAYDGTDFAGWQRQATDRSVQAAIEDALAPIEGERVVVTGAGRTDAGVHAAGQVASLVLRASIARDTLRRALNATLPPDVRILQIDEAADGFNAQFAATQKTYRYWIWAGGIVPPALRRYVWHVPQALDVDSMNEAAASLIGRHDFAAFQGAGGEVKTTERHLLASQVERWPIETATVIMPPAATGDLLVYEVTGTGFLRHMVRNIVGTLIEIGLGRRAASDMQGIVASRNRGRAGATAPPHGLVLWDVRYRD